MTPDPAILDRIRKLLAKTEAAGQTEAEAATAIGLARQLMDKYGLDAATIEAHVRSSCVEEAMGDNLVLPPQSKWIEVILNRFFHVRVFLANQGPSEPPRLLIFGEPIRVEVARWLYGYLQAVFQDRWTVHKTRWLAPDTSRDSFWGGMCAGILRRLEYERQYDPPATGNALAVIERAIVEEWKRQYPEAPEGTTAEPDALAADAVTRGILEGARVSLAREIARD